MGKVDSLIHIHNKNVSLNLRANNNTVIDTLKEETKTLLNALGDKGFKLSRVTYALSEKKITISNAIREANKVFPLMGQSVLDYRI